MSDYKTHYADDQTLAYIAKLEAERAEWKLRALTVESSEEDAQQAAVRFKAERDKLRELVDAVQVPREFGGIYVKDVHGVNWFDARAALQEAE